MSIPESDLDPVASRGVHHYARNRFLDREKIWACHTAMQKERKKQLPRSTPPSTPCLRLVRHMAHAASACSLFGRGSDTVTIGILAKTTFFSWQELLEFAMELDFDEIAPRFRVCLMKVDTCCTYSIVLQRVTIFS